MAITYVVFVIVWDSRVTVESALQYCFSNFSFTRKFGEEQFQSTFDGVLVQQITNNSGFEWITLSKN